MQKLTAIAEGIDFLTGRSMLPDRKHSMRVAILPAILVVVFTINLFRKRKTKTGRQLAHKS